MVADGVSVGVSTDSVESGTEGAGRAQVSCELATGVVGDVVIDHVVVVSR